MSLQIIQRPAAKTSPCLLVVYADPSVGPRLVAAMPKGSGVAVTTETRPALSRGAIARAFGLAEIDQLVASGYSAGCHGLRDMLASLELGPRDHVVPGDGIHIRPSPDPTMPERPWRELVDGARADLGPRVVATHTYVTYTDTMRDDPRTPQIERPYLSTASSIRRLTGWELPEPGAGDYEERSEGRLTVVSYESGEYDQTAHGRQLTEALPDVLQRHVRPWLVSEPLRLVDMLIGPLAAAVWRLRGAELPTASTTAERALVLARAELEAAPRELPGAQHNPRIVAYGDACRRGGLFLGVDAGGAPVWAGEPRLVSARTDEEAWCAKLVSWCYLNALLVGDTPAHGLRVSVAELVADARAADRWRPIESGYRPKPGDLAIWKRAGQDPRVGGSGHVARVETVGADTFVTIGGNESNTILRTVRRYDDRDLVGFIEV